MFTDDNDRQQRYDRRYGRHEGAGRAESPRRRVVPATDWNEDDDDDYIEVKGIALSIVKMWVGPEGAVQS